jgi:hypothetical protein
MAVHVVNPRLGFGNVLINLVDFFRKAPDGRVDENLKDYERGRAFNFNVKFTKDEPSTIDGEIYCNPDAFTYLTTLLPKLMSPTQELADLFQAKSKSIEGVETGIHIRCGSAMPDCKGGLEGSGEDWFITDETFKTVNNILHSYKGSVFLVSDSKEVKKFYKNNFGDKIITFDTDITASCDTTPYGSTQTSKALMDTYLEWYTLSKFPVIYTTSGPGYNQMTNSGAGISTFGYTAAAYGQSQLNIIRYDGALLRM